jgi:hypothetical protein
MLIPHKQLAPAKMQCQRATLLANDFAHPSSSAFLPVKFVKLPNVHITPPPKSLLRVLRCAIGSLDDQIDRECLRSLTGNLAIL